MKVKRIVTNIKATDPGIAANFYQKLLGLKLEMDMDWIKTFEAGAKTHPQLSVLSHGGSDQAAPDMTFEVDDLDEALRRFRDAAVKIEYGPVSEPWGVRRFFVKDPFGKLLNIMAHDD